MSETDESRGPAPFGVRLDAPTLARLDAYAERAGRKRGWAAARAIAAGLDALEGLPVTAPTVAARVDSPGPVLDVDALAVALADRLGAMLAELRPTVDPPASTPTPAPAPDGPRLDPASLRSIAGERRKGAPERRKPPRPDDSGRRLADALRAARSARTLTQRDAAIAAGVSVATYQRAEAGKDTGADTRARLAAWAGAAP
jgi:hypothetical protein